MSAIDEKYAALGGSSGFLGQPTTLEQDCPDHHGRYRHFQGGSIYWTPETSAHEVHGLIRGKWAALGWERSFLGYPLTDETSTPDRRGRYNHFQGGSIYWTPETAAHEVHGLIRGKWAALGWERSFLGYPLTDETPTPDRVGRFNHFQGGSIYWTPQTNANEVHGAIRDKWAALGWERSFLGYPVTDELGTPGVGRFSRFQQGAIYWTPFTGPQETHSPAYVISLDTFHIDNTRAWHEDTDHVAFALKIGNQMLGEPLIRHMGDVNNGDHGVGLHFGPLHIDDPALPIVFNYQILNSGNQNTETIKKALTDGANALAGSSTISGNWWALAAIAVGKWLINIIFADCDGPVAVDQIAVTGADLVNWTTGTGMYRETRVYPGTDSNVGCGSNSRYTVTWSVIRL